MYLRNRHLRLVKLLVTISSLCLLVGAVSGRKPLARVQSTGSAPVSEENSTPTEENGNPSKKDEPSTRHETQQLLARDRRAHANLPTRGAAIPAIQGNTRRSGPQLFASEHGRRNGLGAPLRL